MQVRNLTENERKSLPKTTVNESKDRSTENSFEYRNWGELCKNIVCK